MKTGLLAPPAPHAPPNRDAAPAGDDSGVWPEALSPDIASGTAVRFLTCPGPRFVGRTATRFAHSAAGVCRTQPRLVLDLAAVTAVDAAGLLAISALARACRAAGGELRLCSPNPDVLRLLAGVGIQRLADVYHARRHAGLS